MAERLAAIGSNSRLAVGDPDHVRAGVYGRQALQALGQWQTVRRRLASAEDVRAALAQETTLAEPRA